MNERLTALMGTLAGLVGLVALTGCGEDGAAHDTIVVTSTLRPTVSFTATPDTGDWPLAVAFDGSASSDADGMITRYAWSFGDGSPEASGPVSSHTYTAPGTFTARLTATDDQGAQRSATHTIDVTGPVTLSGRITYDRVPFATDRHGLDFSRTFAAPARGVVVELRQSDGSLLASTVTSIDGRYQFVASENTDVFVRVRAQLSRNPAAAGQPGWDVQILNNTNANAPYVLDGAVRNSGVVNQVRNLHADSGWPDTGGTAYAGIRAAAPFAIADTLHQAISFIIANGNSSQIFEPLNVYWSVNNRPAVGDADFSDGEIGGPAYWSFDADGRPSGIYLLGNDGVDTDEFDTHVITHEFFHFVQSTLSRDDSIGGNHSDADKLDLRVAFSEGFANAFSAMSLNDPVAVNSFGAAQGDAGGFDIEGNTWTNPGCFSEGSVQSIVWDLFDSTNDGPDTTRIPFNTIYDVLRTDLRDTPALTSLFVFITGLKARPGLNLNAIDAIVQAQNIVASTLDAYGSTEVNDGGLAEALPVYTQIALNGPSVQVCGIADTTSFYNKLGNRRFLRFSVPTMRAVTIRVVGLEAGPPDLPAPNPDLALYLNGLVDSLGCSGPTGESCTQPINTEQYENTVPAGDYILEVFDRSHVDDTSGIRPSTCMDVTVTG